MINPSTNQPAGRSRRRQAAQRHLERLLLARHPGEPLPPIRELMRETGLGRLALEHALAGLAAAGAVERRPRRGLFRTAVPLPRAALAAVDLVLCSASGRIAFADEFFGEFLAVFADALTGGGYSLRLHGLADAEPAAALEERLRRAEAAAVVLYAPASAETVRAAARACPRWAAAYPRTLLADPRVMQDNPDMVPLQLGHLFSLGHRRIGYLDQTDPQAPAAVARERREAFYRLMAGRGLRVRPEWVGYGGFTEAGIFAALTAMFRPRPPPTAVICADMQLPAVYRFLERRGLRPGADCAVVATDDLRLAARMDPPATSVTNDRAGAARLLLRLLETGPAAETGPAVAPLTLTVRASTGPVLKPGQSRTVRHKEHKEHKKVNSPH